MTPLCTIEANNTVSGHKKFLSTCDSLFQCYLTIILRFDKLSGEVGSEVSVMMLSVSPPYNKRAGWRGDCAQLYNQNETIVILLNYRSESERGGTS